MKQIILALGLVASPAFSQTADMVLFSKANDLGNILASEAFCGLSYDQPAIETWIAENVPPDSMDFAPTLQTMIMGAEYSIQNMSASAKTAHCAAVSQSAKHYGFVK